MDWRDLARLVFWTWLIISAVILIRRSVNKRAARREEELAEVPFLTDPPTTSEPAATLGDAPTSDHSPTPPTPAASSDFASARPDPPASTGPGSNQPIAAMVTGIQLPCDLAPVVDFQRRDAVRESVAFVTRGHAAGTVGQAVADELTRLGFETDSLGTSDVVAVRGADRLNVAVLAEAGALERAGRPAFPGAGDGAVVVEFWI